MSKCSCELFRRTTIFSDIVVGSREPTLSVSLFIGGGHHAVDYISKVIRKSPNKMHLFGGIVGNHFRFKELLLNRALR